MDDLRHFPHAPRDERAFGRNDSVLGSRDGTFKPANAGAPLNGAFGRDYPRDLGYHVQMRDLHHARGGASGHNDSGGKCFGDEERGRERDRYTDRDRNRNWRCDADSARDRDRDRVSDRDRQYTPTWRPSKPFIHVDERNITILNNSDTIELFRG